MARFVERAFLGRGGFGRVYRARDTEEGGLVAIKYLLRDDPDTRRRFAHEIRLLQRHCGHPNIVHFVDYGVSSRNGPFLVVRYYERGSLRKRVETNLGWKRVALAVMDAAWGLTAVHATGGFHRDIKPDNLLVSWSARRQREVVRISDFGLAREPVTGAPNVTRSPFGTDGYIAPEVLLGHPYTRRADIFSLGVTGVELLTGWTDRRSLAYATVPRDMRCLLLEMCAGRPSQRPTAEEVANELRWLLTSPRADRSTIVANQPTERTNWWPILGTVALGALAAGGLAYMASSED